MVSEKDMIIVTIRLPKKLAKKMDLLIKDGEFYNKSEIVRAALREFLEKKGENI